MSAESQYENQLRNKTKKKQKPKLRTDQSNSVHVIQLAGNQRKKPQHSDPKNKQTLIVDWYQTNSVHVMSVEETTKNQILNNITTCKQK